MLHFDAADRSLDFLRYDLVNLAYSLPGIKKSAVIGVGGGRDLVSANLFGVRDITGVELNPDLHRPAHEGSILRVLLQSPGHPRPETPRR